MITGAEVLHYGNAHHYLETNSGENIWIVIGNYEHHLIKASDQWKIDQMKFYLKFMDGNMNLPQLAQEKIKS